MTPPSLIIFDCDGVLVDSEPISIAVLTDVITRGGGVINEDGAYRHFLGKSMATISEVLAVEFGFIVTQEHLTSIRAELRRRLREELKPIPGVRAAVAGLKTAHCVASSSQPERIRLSLGLTGLLPFFEPHIYSAVMVDKGKPAPDLFLHAARDMGVEPAGCLVIEDSPAGIQAAKSAGMRVFGFTGGSHAHAGGLAQSLAPLEPDAIFDDMRRLPALMASFGKGG